MPEFQEVLGLFPWLLFLGGVVYAWGQLKGTVTAVQADVKDIKTGLGEGAKKFESLAILEAAVKSLAENVAKLQGMIQNGFSTRLQEVEKQQEVQNRLCKEHRAAIQRELQRVLEDQHERGGKRTD